MKKKSTISLLSLGLFSVFSLSVNAQLINEGFEAGVPPSGWTAENGDALTTFTAGSVGKTGSSSALYNAFDQTGPEKGQADALISPAVNLSSVTSHSFTFYYAYQMYSDPASYTSADSLNVYISTDAGVTWTSVFSKTSNALVTAAVPFDPNAGYIPTSSEWVMETVDISAYATATSAQFKFEFVNDYENNFYLDDILLISTSGVNDINLDAYVNVFPNPSQGNVNVDLSASGLGQTDIVIYNMVGEEVERVSHNVISPKRVKFNLEDQPNGVYFVNVQTENGVSTKKLILNK